MSFKTVSDMNLSKLYKQLGILIIGLILSNNHLLAQGETPDFARSMGKMYVVVAVIVAIFLGIISFLIYMERRVTKLEQQLEMED